MLRDVTDVAPESIEVPERWKVELPITTGESCPASENNRSSSSSSK